MLAVWIVEQFLEPRCQLRRKPAEPGGIDQTDVDQVLNVNLILATVGSQLHADERL